MTDDSSAAATEPWLRLIWARQRLYDTAEAAAQALGMKGTTYRQYERRPGSSRWANLDYDRAVQFGRKFRVNWRWLLTGEGHPLDTADDNGAEQLLASYHALPDPQRKLLLEIARNLGHSPSPWTPPEGSQAGSMAVHEDGAPAPTPGPEGRRRASSIR